jgi:hypothetical protein
LLCHFIFPNSLKAIYQLLPHMESIYHDAYVIHNFAECVHTVHYITAYWSAVSRGLLTMVLHLYFTQSCALKSVYYQFKHNKWWLRLLSLVQIYMLCSFCYFWHYCVDKFRKIVNRDIYGLYIETLWYHQLQPYLVLRDIHCTLATQA